MFPFLRRTLALSILSLAASTSAFCQDAYPSKPIHVVIPTAPGSVADVFSRLIAQGLQEGLGQTVVADNKPGANGIIAASFVAKSPPDGYTVLFAVDSMLTMVQHAMSQMPYKPETDLKPISLVADNLVVLVSNTSLHVDSVADLVAAAKRRPGEISFGQPNFTVQVMAEQFSNQAGIKLLAIPYKGAGESSNAVLSGDVNLSFDTPFLILPNLASGRVNILASTGFSRSPALNNVPTFKELGYEGLESGVWNALMVPKATPKAITDRLNREVVRILNKPEVIERFKSFGSEAKPTTVEAATAFISAEDAKWKSVIEKAGIKIN